MPGRAARLWSPMPAALIWYLVKPRRESGAAFLEGTQRGEHEDHCAHSVTACCSAAIWCRDPACLCHKRARRASPSAGRRRKREKDKESKKREMERERASKEERRHRRAYRRQAAVTEVISSNRAACFARDGRQGPWLPGQNQGLEGRSASKTAAMSCFCFALALASSLRSNPA